MSDETLADEADVEWPLLHVLRRGARPHLAYFYAGLAAAILSGVIGNVTTLFIGTAFDVVFDDGDIWLPVVAAWAPESRLGRLWFIGGLWVAVSTLGLTAAFGKEWCLNRFGQRTLDDVRVQTFDAAQRQDLAFFDRYKTGNLMTVLNSDVNSLESSLSGSIHWAVLGAANIGSALLFMTLLNWQLTLFVFVMVPVLLGVNYYFSRVLERVYDPVRQAAGALNGRIETSLAGVDVIKAHGAEAFERGRLREASSEFRDTQWTANRVSLRQDPIVSGVTGVTMAGVLLVGGIWVVEGPPSVFAGALTAGQLISFVYYLRGLEGPIGNISGLVNMYKRAKASAKRIVGVRESDRRRDDNESTERLDAVAGRVAYDDVTFSYPGSDETVIDGVSFAVDAGETVGVVGSTGAGKSTLLKLLCRFYDPDSGQVRVDGRDVREVDVESLRSAIGYVDQDPFLFDGTVRENIAYGLGEAEHREASNGERGAKRAASGDGAASESPGDAVEAAAREAGAHAFVADLPDGYDTEVGQRGVKLSGGQRQRIALARALVSDPEMLVLDEATSHVDNETEVLIQRNLRRLTEDRTTFVIAHRLSTVRGADDILVMDDGELVERGDHETLVEREGTYANLWHVQVGKIEKLPDEFVERVTADD